MGRAGGDSSNRRADPRRSRALVTKDPPIYREIRLRSLGTHRALHRGGGFGAMKRWLALVLSVAGLGLVGCAAEDVDADDEEVETGSEAVTRVTVLWSGSMDVPVSAPKTISLSVDGAALTRAGAKPD